MTVPLIGSGITNSIVTSTMLAISIREFGTNLEALWDYQYTYMTKRGWEDASLNCIKKLLLDEKSIDFLFNKKLLRIMIY